MPRESFSMRVKEEACGQVSQRRHCQIAELAGLISLCSTKIEKNVIKIYSENVSAEKKVFTLLEKTFNIEAFVAVRSGKTTGKHRTYIISVSGEKNVKEILEAIKHPLILGKGINDPVDDIILLKNCCRRAFIRGCLLAAGSITDPQKAYHLEIVCPSQAKAMQVCDCINSFWQNEEGLLLFGEGYLLRDGQLSQLTRSGDCLDLSDFE